jgi:uncharacterized protein (DUF1786 family)
MSQRLDIIGKLSQEQVEEPKMKVLTVDIGTGTQDIYLYDARVDIENGFKLIVPSPTMLIHQRIRAAARDGLDILLTGTTMGGGPSQWAAEDHIRTGLKVFATPDAARSFNDDLNAVAEMGILVVSEDEAQRYPDSVLRIELRDFDFQAISAAFSGFGVSLNDLSAVAVAVFDHGNAPPDVSDRQFRFDYLDERIRAKNRLSAFAYRAEEIPAIMTRLQSAASSAAGIDAPLVVMDTAPAAVLGATFDPRLEVRSRCLVANVGNFHTLAFRLGSSGIEGVFEHHTGLIDTPKLDGLLKALADGSLQHEDVFGDHGHGALVYSGEPLDFLEGDFGVAVTGPRRNMMRSSELRPYFPAPFGDMMIAGCFGLLAATADLVPDTTEAIQASLSRRGGSGTPPWEVM